MFLELLVERPHPFRWAILLAHVGEPIQDAVRMFYGEDEVMGDVFYAATSIGPEEAAVASRSAGTDEGEEAA